MTANRVLLFTDVEGSTQLTEKLGDAVASVLWTEHDRIARHLMRVWQGQEIDKSDGFLVLFAEVASAVRFAMDMHRALGRLTPPLKARAGIHFGDMVSRKNPPEDVTLGAKPLELDGVAKAVASRIMAIARGGQTLLSASARKTLGDGEWILHSHGHWRMKGVAEPIELFEVGSGSETLIPPENSEKSFRVVRTGNGWVAVSALPHNIPAERDQFVGRDDALDALAALFHDGRRLVTAIGIGGVGKTRLAVRYARAWLGEYPGGAWFCNLSPASSLDGVALAVAQGLDVPLGKADPIHQLGAALAGRGVCLVILDNFEQVARHAEVTVGQWLERAPEARFLITSREVLGIPGEETFVLAPLPNAAAVRLFEARALAANHTFEMGGAEHASVVKLVELLDRLPLAIELAAARIRVMPPRVMLDRMDQRFKLLASSGGRRERQATLRATLDWSWDLLSKVEQSALAQLSVFEGGFTLEAAEAVIALPRGEAASEWTPDVVQGLVEKSLLRNVSEQRFDMLRSVQDYAAERLDDLAAGVEHDPRADQARRRHWTHFASLDEASSTANRCADTENLIAACRRSSSSDPPSAVGALSGAWATLQLIGPFRTALELVSLVEANPALTHRQQAVVQRVAGSALSLLGENQKALDRCEAGFRQAIEAGDLVTVARLQCLIANIQITRGVFDQADRHFGEAMVLANKLGDVRLRVRALSGMGALRYRKGELTEAMAHYEEAMPLAAMAGERRWLGGLHGNLGVLAQTQGRLADARRHLETSLQHASELGDRQWEGNARCNLGLLLIELQQLEDADAEFQAALAIVQSIGNRRVEATVLCNLGNLADSRHQFEDAIDFYRQAISIANTLGDPVLVAQFSGYLALALTRANRHDESAARFQEALAKAPMGSNPLLLCMLHCQRAIAAKERGDEPGRCEAWARATELLTPGEAVQDPELSRALEAARE